MQHFFDGLRSERTIISRVDYNASKLSCCLWFPPPGAADLATSYKVLIEPASDHGSKASVAGPEVEVKRKAGAGQDSGS